LGHTSVTQRRNMVTCGKQKDLWQVQGRQSDGHL